MNITQHKFGVLDTSKQAVSFDTRAHKEVAKAKLTLNKIHSSWWLLGVFIGEIPPDAANPNSGRTPNGLNKIQGPKPKFARLNILFLIASRSGRI